MFLLLRGKLPFDGKNKDEVHVTFSCLIVRLSVKPRYQWVSQIIDRTLMAILDFSHPHWKTISDDAKSLISGLLARDPIKRLTPEQAQAHAWFEPVRSRLAAVLCQNGRSLCSLFMACLVLFFCFPIIIAYMFRDYPFDRLLLHRQGLLRINSSYPRLAIGIHPWQCLPP